MSRSTFTLANVRNLENFPVSNPVLIADNLLLGTSTTDPTVTHLGIVKHNNQTGELDVLGFINLSTSQVGEISATLHDIYSDAIAALY